MPTRSYPNPSIADLDQRASTKLPQALQLIGPLCLLEPTIGVVWQYLFGRSLGVALELHHYALLGSALWLVYVFDRWVDAIYLGAPSAHTVRHRFMVSHRWPVAITWCAVLALALGTASATLNELEGLTGAALLLLTVGYFALVLGLRSRFVHKELAVALIYTCGITLYYWPRLDLPALAASIAFAGLVLVNLSTIAVGERRIDVLQGQASVATRHPTLEHTVQTAVWVLVPACWFAGLSLRSWAPLYLAIAASALCLSLVLRFRHAMRPDTLHLAADAALLTPLFWV
jgi:hypothetical protein